MDHLMIESILTRAVAAATPLLFAATGEIVSERSGVLNLGVEGMMAVGAVTGFAVATATGNLGLAVGAAALAAMAVSAIHGFISVALLGNQVVSGLALTMFGLGLSGLIGKPFIGRSAPVRFMPVDSSILSDLPILGSVMFEQDPLCYLAFGMALLTWVFIYHTRWGISLRAAGEHPLACESMGHSVVLIRWLATLFGGACAGLAGAYLSLAYSASWIEGMTAGRGWIVIALTIFAAWNPLRAAWGACLFGGVYVLQYVLQNKGIAPNILMMLPYVTTLLVLVLGATKRNRRRFNSPVALGEAFHREMR